MPRGKLLDKTVKVSARYAFCDHPLAGVIKVPADATVQYHITQLPITGKQAKQTHAAREFIGHVLADYVPYRSTAGAHGQFELRLPHANFNRGFLQQVRGERGMCNACVRFLRRWCFAMPCVATSTACCLVVALSVVYLFMHTRLEHGARHVHSICVWHIRCLTICHHTHRSRGPSWCLHFAKHAPKCANTALQIDHKCTETHAAAWEWHSLPVQLLRLHPRPLTRRCQQ